jgi:hypothetical protein
MFCGLARPVVLSTFLILIGWPSALAQQPAAPVRPGQHPVQWSGRPKEAVARARHLDRPVLFYVGSSAEEDNDLEDNQQVAFRDPIVRSIIEDRFVAVRLPRSPQNFELLNKIGASPPYELSLQAATAEGKLIGTINATTAGNAQRLADALTSMYRAYRTSYFQEYLEPLFDPEARATDAELENALRMIRKLTLLEADSAVVSLLDRDSLSDRLREAVLHTLAELSTPATVKALVERATTDPKARDALLKCTPGAGEALLPFLDVNEVQYSIAYQAAAVLCKVPSPRPARFFDNAERQKIEEELLRVRDIVRDCATQWNSTYGLYR